MCKIVCVTNPTICRDDLYARLTKIRQSGVSRIVLRNTELSEEQYRKWLETIQERCETLENMTAYRFRKVAQEFGLRAIHLPFAAFLEKPDLTGFTEVGTSVHSVEQAIAAEAGGANYLIAGHIYPTDCKQGLPARGEEFLRSICSAVSIPVYAIGGIHLQQARELANTGIPFAGICLMSEYMQCQNIMQTTQDLQKALRGNHVQ